MPASRNTGDPAYVAKSSAAAKRARGTVFANNALGREFHLNFAGTAVVEVDCTPRANSGEHVTVGGTAPLGGASVVTIASTPAPPAPPVLIPYLAYSGRLQGTAKVQLRDLPGLHRASCTAQVSGDNEVCFEPCSGDSAVVNASGSGSLSLSVVSFEGRAIMGGLDQSRMAANVQDSRVQGNVYLLAPAAGPVTVTDCTFQHNAAMAVSSASRPETGTVR